jgi:hypothetical protein
VNVAAHHVLQPAKAVETGAALPDLRQLWPHRVDRTLVLIAGCHRDGRGTSSPPEIETATFGAVGPPAVVVAAKQLGGMNSAPHHGTPPAMTPPPVADAIVSRLMANESRSPEI